MNRKGALFILFLLLLLTGGAVIAFLLRKNLGVVGPSIFPALRLPGIPQPKEERQAQASLDGALVPESLANRRPLAVVIENHPEARPQVGLVEASLVFEAVTEGGITRFLAFYQGSEPTKVGPVRSARHAFVDWVRAFGALFAHVGGNPAVLERVRRELPYDLDQFRYGSRAYWRESMPGVAVEHTMFASPERLRGLAAKNRWPPLWDRAFGPFRDDAPHDERGKIETVSIDFGSPRFAVLWRYDREANRFAREIAGKPHTDRFSGRQIFAANVIVIELRRNYLEEERTWKFTTEGSGRAWIFQNGRLLEGSFEQTRDRPPRFLDETGRPISLVRGPTWIEVLHPELAKPKIHP